MWILPEWNQLFGSSCLQGGSPAQQGKSESCGWFHSTPNLPRNQGFFRLNGTLPMVHQRNYKDSTTIAWTSFQRGCKQEEWVCNTHRRGSECLCDAKEGLSQGPCTGFCWLNKPFLLDTHASKRGLGAVLSQKQTNDCYHLVTYTSWSVNTQESNYHSTKLEFLALKWVIYEWFQKYLLWKLFIVKTDNNLVTYLMTTPNLHATWHCWVESLARFT